MKLILIAYSYFVVMMICTWFIVSSN